MCCSSLHETFHDEDRLPEEFEAFVCSKSMKSLMVRVASGRSRPRQQAVIQLSFVGRGWLLSAAELGVCLDFAAAGANATFVRKHDEPGQEGSHRLQAARPPLARERPSPTVTNGSPDLPGELAGDGVGCASAE